MARRLFLHIGMYKTGSTSIQASLENHDDGRVRYARLGGHNHSAAVVPAFSRDPAAYQPHRQKGLTRAEADALAAEARARLAAELALDRDTLIVSGEAIPSLAPGALAAFRDFVRPHVGEIAVFAYVREPIGYASSMFQQLVRAGQRDFPVPVPAYRDKFEHVIGVFGRGNVAFRRYDRARFPDGSVVADFLRIVGIDPAQVQARWANAGLSSATTRLLHRFNRSGVSSFGDPRLLKGRARLVRTLDGLFPGRFKIPEEIVAAALDPDDVAWMEEIAGFALAADPSPDASADADAFRSIVEHVAPEEVERLRAHMAGVGVPFDPHEDVGALLGRLYYHLLFGPRLEDRFAIVARDLAVRLEKHPDFGLKDAADLMEIAHRIRPGGEIIRKRLDKYRRALAKSG